MKKERLQLAEKEQMLNIILRADNPPRKTLSLIEEGFSFEFQQGKFETLLAAAGTGDKEAMLELTFNHIPRVAREAISCERYGISSKKVFESGIVDLQEKIYKASHDYVSDSRTMGSIKTELFSKRYIDKYISEVYDISVNDITWLKALVYTKEVYQKTTGEKLHTGEYIDEIKKIHPELFIPSNIKLSKSERERIEAWEQKQAVFLKKIDDKHELLTQQKERPHNIAYTPSVEDEIEKIELAKELIEAFKHLSPAERALLMSRYFEGHTLKTISVKNHVPAWRIRQIEANALRRLRHPSVRYRLKPFFEQDTIHKESVCFC